MDLYFINSILAICVVGHYICLHSRLLICLLFPFSIWDP